MSKSSNLTGLRNYSFVSGLPVTTDDVVRVVTSAGAGYRDFKNRDRAAIAADIKAGFIRAERDAEVYGD
ncbi:hypothetical protein [Labrenzia sp. CE80]|uniref:hypothetical protein n=1 Tax=Labrenzia sp. CE80 TaxID=1788986 RepID=UPI00129BE7EC|nr:hypothetical protein [Labrenzia sp. CE80]